MNHEEIIKKIKHDIRNTRGLNEEQLKYMLQLSDREKNELIILMNESLQALHDYLLECTK